MTISGIDSTSSVGAVSSYGTVDTTSVEEQIAKLEQEIRELQQDKDMDEKVKSQQISLYQAQISQLRAQASGSTYNNNAQGITGQKFDVVDISEQGRNFMDPPPKLDFATMSNDELKTWLTNMQNETGSIPGTNEEIDLNNISKEQLDEIRNALLQGPQSNRPAFTPAQQNAIAGQLNVEDEE